MSTQSPMKKYRILEDGVYYATVMAYDVDQAIERAYQDDSPGNLINLEVQERKCRKDGIQYWSTVWEGRIGI